jgi:hypothetical protein
MFFLLDQKEPKNQGSTKICLSQGTWAFFVRGKFLTALSA